MKLSRIFLIFITCSGLFFLCGDSSVAYANVTVTAHPQNRTTALLRSVQFSVLASGDGELFYQWQGADADGIFFDIDGATASSFSISSVRESDNNSVFRVIVGDFEESAPSNSARLFVSDSNAVVMPGFMFQPMNVAVPAGITATFRTQATGAPFPLRQWQRADPGGLFIDIPGAVGDEYSLVNTGIEDSGARFRVVAAHHAGSAVSRVATLTVHDGFSPSTLSVSADKLFFTHAKGDKNPLPKFFIVTNTGEEIMEWSASVNEPWLAIAPRSGALAYTERISLESTVTPPQSPGVYNGSITINAPGAAQSPATVLVQLTVYATSSIGGPTVTVAHDPWSPFATSAVSITARASSPEGVSMVWIYVDGELALSCSGSLCSTAPHTYSLGTHLYYAIGEDSNGVSKRSPATGAKSFLVRGIDTVSPRVVIRTPLDGAIITSTTPITVEVSDNLGVKGVQYIVNGIPISSEIRYPPFSLQWNVSKVPEGAQTLVAVARDVAGNKTESPPVRITVQKHRVIDTVSPVISIVLPRSGAMVDGVVPFIAYASDNVRVASVQFSVDGAHVGVEAKTSPYRALWDTKPDRSGVHTISAVARDTSGNIGISQPITVYLKKVSSTIPRVPTPTRVPRIPTSTPQKATSTPSVPKNILRVPTSTNRFPRNTPVFPTSTHRVSTSGLDTMQITTTTTMPLTGVPRASPLVVASSSSIQPHLVSQEQTFSFRSAMQAIINRLRTLTLLFEKLYGPISYDIQQLLSKVFTSP